jgi:peptidoglycan/xylan/chitin deacetylase (PgdA/CDA1 family)
VPLVIMISRRRTVLGALCAGLVLLAGCSASHSGRDAVFVAPSGSPAAPGGSAPAEPQPGPPPSGAPSAPAPDAPLGQPVGWRLSDLPRFPPAPTPQRITLDRGGRVPVLSRLPVAQPVAFLTIDDGYLKPAEAEKLFAAARVPVTLFLTTDAIRDNVKYFDRLRPYGAVIEAHTISHANLRGRPDAFQKRQVCGSADRLGEWYGRRPVLFRPPFGNKDATTVRAAGECGMKAVLLWKETVHKGKVRFQEGQQVRAGDVILMHFRPAFVQDFIAALRAIHRAGLTPARLEDYLPA